MGLHLPRGGAAEVGPLVVGELHFARLACAPRAGRKRCGGPQERQAGKVVPGGHWAASGADFPRPTPARTRRGGWEGPCQISRPTARFLPETASRRETRTTHRPTSYEPLLPNSSQIVVGHVVNDVRRCGGPIGSKRRQKRRSQLILHGFWPFSRREAAQLLPRFLQRVVRLPAPTA